MKKMLTHNLGLKILAVVLAVFTWLIMVNASNPLMTDTQSIPVEVINEDVLKDAGLTYELVGRDTVTVSYKVHVRDEHRISAGDFTAYADLAQLYDVTGAVPVQVEASRTARQFLASDVLTVSPMVVQIQTEKIQTKLFDLTARTEGDLEDDHAVGGISVSPSVVYVTGAESVIGQISSAGIEINIDGANTEVQGQAEIHFYDANDNILDGLGDTVSLSVSEASYTVTVLDVKDLVLDFQVTGSAANGYRFTGVTSDVQTVSVEGLRSALAELTTLTVSGEALNVEGAVQDVTATVDLAEYLPPNVSLTEDSPVQAVVTMTVEPLETMPFTYDVGQIDMLGLSGRYRYVFADQQMELRIRGLAEDLESLRAADIDAAMDLNGLGPGEHQVTLSVTLPDGFEFIGPASVTIRIEEDAEVTQPATPSSEEETTASE